MRFYIASGLENIDRVKLVKDKILSLGHEITYDWTEHGDVRDKGEEMLAQVAANETYCVVEADCVLILLPGGRGTHTELGLALAKRSNKRIILWSETGREFNGGADTCVFYHHNAVERLHCSFDELISFIETL